MYEYVNGYSCAVDTECDNVVLNFRQRVPSFDDEGKLVKVEVSSVASIIMDLDMAKQLGKALCNLGEEDALDTIGNSEE